MDRRTFIRLTGAASISGPLAMKAQATAATRSRPNFLFFIADDLCYRAIGATNHEVRTPRIDHLVDHGCHFTHCFYQGSWSGAICMPSRTMLNSGLSAFRAQDGIDHVPVWGETLQNNGYDTYIAGKWHVPGTALKRSFKEKGPVGPGFLPSTPNMYDRPSSGNTWQPWDESLKGHWLHTAPWKSEPKDIEHSSVLYSDQAIKHLREDVAQSDAPFFMYVAFNAPHDPRQAPKEFEAMYPQSSIEVPPNFLPEHPFNPGYSRVRDELLAPFPRTKEAVQLHRSEYYAIITHMDEQIGRVLDELQKIGKAHNTYIILTADHGLCCGEHGLLGKQNQYDASQRMPLVMVGPGIPKGRKVDELVYQHCMYATTCELAGINVPSHVEFPSLIPLLMGGSTPLYDATFSYLNAVQRSVRTKMHKLIFYPQIQRTQVFDLVKDPWEITDVSDSSAYANVRKELWARLLKFQRELSDPLNLEHPTKPTAHDA